MNTKKYKIFISSVQNEFENERKLLVDFILSDILLSSFFSAYIFERNAADTNKPESVYISELQKADIYIGLIGKEYGYEDSEGISPTEREYDAAKNKCIPRWIYILKSVAKRHPKEEKLLKKLSEDVSWKFFENIESLKKEVYYTCFEFLKQKGKIENSDFDSGLHPYATLADINEKHIQNFISLARKKRNFPQSINTPLDVLKRLFLIRDKKIVNSALLMFAEKPQEFFPVAIVKCAHFHGVTVMKPIPDFKQFDGSILEMAEQTINFILDKIAHSTGSRQDQILVDTEYEIPREIIAEAVINALAHRDYSSNGSVQVSVFKDRIEIENPGHLPDEISLDDLKIPHASYAQNPLLAKCLFNVGAIEGYGTGTLEMTNIARSKGLPEPIFTSATNVQSNNSATCSNTERGFVL
jgi:ATP-dependent DNA helicase RecG